MRLRPRDWKLGTRFTALVLGLLLLIQLVIFAATRHSIAANARASVAAELEVGERALRSLLAQDALRLADASRVLAADFGFRDAVLSGDGETLRDALRNHGNRIGASLSAVLDNQFAVRASSTDDDAALNATAARVGAAWARRGEGETPSVVTAWDGRPTQFVLVPLRAPLQVGWVLMGFALDERLSQRMRNVSALDLALLVQKAPGAPWRSAVTMLTAPVDEALRAAGPAAPAYALLAGTEFGVRQVGLSIDGGDTVRGFLLRSVDDAVRPYQHLQLVLAAITLIGVLAFGIGTTLAARRVTHPVRKLVTAAQRLGDGDLATPVAGTWRADEIGELARTFEDMRCNLARQDERLRQVAYWDELTGLPNRAGIALALQAAIEAKEPAHACVSLLMLDLDRFKAVNKATSHAFGDRLLKATAERLGAFVTRPGDQLARLSGDEFALMLPGRDSAAAKAVADRIAEELETPVILDDQAVDLPAGIGVATWPEHEKTAQKLLVCAESAMNDAKQRKLGPRIYDTAADAASAVNLSLLSELREAVRDDQLRLFLQPKVSLVDGRLLGAEALVRWQHPVRGMIPPMQFIPFAEQTGAVRALTRWMFKAAVRHWAELRGEDGRPLCVSVNLSTHDLLDQQLPDTLAGVLAEHGAPADAFCLEITESAIMDDPQRAEATLQRLSERGFKLSIDDFGTGYSSLGYLKRLPVDELKIDRSFVQGMVDDADDAKLVRLVVDLAHNLGLTVVAEGVENAPIWNALHRLGCDEAQGYHMSRPLPVEAFVAWAERWNDRVATGWGGLEVA